MFRRFSKSFRSTDYILFLLKGSHSMKMVKFMPYVFFFMLYTYASALSVYMCVSSAWGIVGLPI